MRSLIDGSPVRREISTFWTRSCHLIHSILRWHRKWNAFVAYIENRDMFNNSKYCHFKLFPETVRCMTCYACCSTIWKRQITRFMCGSGIVSAGQSWSIIQLLCSTTLKLTRRSSSIYYPMNLLQSSERSSALILFRCQSLTQLLFCLT